jgi:hypothetical protein
MYINDTIDSGRVPMRTASRIAACLLCVVLHASGSPNSKVDATDAGRCLTFDQAEALGMDVERLREDYTAAVEVFPGQKSEVADAWSDLQYELRRRLEASGAINLGGGSMFSIFFFEPDGHIARVIHRGLDPEQARVFCEVVESLAEEYRFPLKSNARFSQCGTTHFSAH